MLPTVLTIQTLGFITGAVLFILLVRLSLRAGYPVKERAARLLAATMGLLWNLGNAVEYVLRIAGVSFDALPIRLARAVSYTGTAFLSTAVFLFMLSAAGHAARRMRQFVPVSLVLASGLAIGFFTFAILPDGSHGFDRLQILSAYNLGLHLVVGIGLRKRPQDRSGYRRALLLSVTALAAMLFLLIHFEWSPFWEMLLVIIAQQSSIPMALISLAWLSQFRFADLFVKQSFLILAAVLCAMIYQGFVVSPAARLIGGRSAQPEAARWIVATLLWAGLLLVFPLLRGKLLQAADRAIFRRPDYSLFLRDFQRESGAVEDPQTLFALAEQRICSALKLTSVKIEAAGAASDPAFPIRTSGPTYALVLDAGRRRLLSDEIALLNSMTESIGRSLEAIRFEAERRELALREARLQQLLTESELKALRAQINPHFLFNTLNTIADLISEAPDRAEQLTEQLSDVFRHALSRANRSLISLDEEFAFLQTYLKIEHARFGDRLRVEFACDPRIGTMQIPSLLLQPLVENAIKHGLAATPGGGTVRIQAEDLGETLRLIVADNGGGWCNNTAEGHHMGLKNVSERLRLLYSHKAQLAIESAPGQGTCITITLPKHEAQNDSDRRRSTGAIAAQEAALGAS